MQTYCCSDLLFLCCQRKRDSSSSEDSDADRSKYLTPTSSTPVTPAPALDGGAEKKHKKKHKQTKDGETVDTPAEENTEKKVERTYFDQQV